jgi:hypothetical protein
VRPRMLFALPGRRDSAGIACGATMIDQPPSPPSAADVTDGLAEKPVFAPYNPPAGGWGALRATANALREQSIVLKGSNPKLAPRTSDFQGQLPRRALADNLGYR